MFLLINIYLMHVIAYISWLLLSDIYYLWYYICKFQLQTSSQTSMVLAIKRRDTY